jgi:hypothetical protein
VLHLSHLNCPGGCSDILNINQNLLFIAFLLWLLILRFMSVKVIDSVGMTRLYDKDTATENKQENMI